MQRPHHFPAVAALLALVATACAPFGAEIGDAELSTDELRRSSRPCRPGSKTACCGDDVCSTSETCTTCARDCGTCVPPAPIVDGDTAPADPPSPPEAPVVPPPTPSACGDDLCGDSETCSSCARDCGVCCPDGGPRVFPGAAGFGTCTPAGRRGQILAVTNLNDAGAGSLRAALLTSGPRTVVFEVGGNIRLSNPIVIKSGALTVAGQTAPAPGITITDSNILVQANDVLLQHLRIRVGDRTAFSNTPDAITVGGYTGSLIFSRVVIDHCSLSWAIDENFDAVRVDGLTLSNSIISEGLHDSFNNKDMPHSKAILTSIDARVTLVGNLVAHNDDRHPNVGGPGAVISVNNLWYDAGRRWVSISDGYLTGRPILYTDVGNHYIDGPSTTLSWTGALYYLHSSLPTGTQVFIDDNIYDGTGAYMRNGAGAGVLTTSRPVWDDSIRPLPSAEVESSVLAHAGARPAARDATDARIVTETVTRTGRIINCVAPDGSTRCALNAGGWPTLAASQRAFPRPADPDGDADGDGYTNLEELLHQMAAAVEGRLPASP